MFAMIAFCVAYAQVAQHRNWPLALGIALGVGALVALILSWLPASLPLSSLIALVALLTAPHTFLQNDGFFCTGAGVSCDGHGMIGVQARPSVERFNVIAE